MLTCNQAHEIYKTVLFRGYHRDAEQLLVHARDCRREDWTHALLTEHWPQVRMQRERDANWRDWQTKQATVKGAMAEAFDREFTGLSGVDA